MSLFKRFKMIAEAKANKVADRAEDPTETIELSYTKMQELGRQTKNSIVEVATSKARLSNQLRDLQASIVKLDGQARQALSGGNEDLAKRALERKQLAQAQYDSIQPQLEELERKQTTLENASKQFDAKIRALEVEKETLKATYQSAKAQVRLKEAVTGIGEEMNDIGLAMQRAKDKTKALEARGAGIDELYASGTLNDLTAGPSDDIQAELNAMGSSSVDGELAKMKAELTGGSSPKAIDTSATNTTATNKDEEGGAQ